MDDRLPLAALAVGLVAVVAVLAAVPYLPFVDLPNHQLVLEMARAFRAGETSPYFELPGGTAFTYTLFARVDALLAPVLSTGASLRLLAIGAAAGLPLAVWSVARRVAPGVAAWAAVLSLPLAVSWPTQLGFLSYMLGVPCALLAAGWAVDACAPGRGWRAPLLTAVALALAYLAHPLACALGAALVALAWLTFGTPRLGRLLLLAATGLPAAALAAWDLTHAALERVPGINAPVTSDSARRTLGRSLVQLVVFGLDLVTWRDVLWMAPFALLVLGLVVAGLRRAPGPRAGIFAGVAALLVAALSVAIPSVVPGAVLVGERVGTVAFAVAAIPAAWGAAALPRAARLASLAIVAVALGHLLAGTAREGGRIAALVGDHPPRALEGRWLAVVADCAPRDEALPWGAPQEPLFHVWAYAMHPTRGFTPYTFATRAYQAVRHRLGEFVFTRGPEVVRAIPGDPGLCPRFAAEDLADSLVPRARDFAGTLLIGERSLLERLVRQRPEQQRWLGPGMVALVRIPGRR